MTYCPWRLAPQDEDAARRLAAETGMPQLVCGVLAARGCGTPEAARALCGPGGRLGDPMRLSGMPQAVARIQQAIDNGERIVVFGDYDVDGVTATALLYAYLDSAGADVYYKLPSRGEDGYGLSEAAVELMDEKDVTLIITVDSGISAAAAVRRAKELGMDVVVTDHHLAPAQLPEAAAVVDPQQPGDESGCGMLAGAGVAFKLVCALEGCDAEELLPVYGDLAAIGTVADIMPLVGENRRMVKAGLALLQETDRPGLAALIRQCGLEGKRLTAENISFALAPRLNAAGRMDDATTALELLLCEDEAQAAGLAAALEEKNAERQKTEQHIAQSVLDTLATDPSYETRPHPGGVGRGLPPGRHWHCGLAHGGKIRQAGHCHCRGRGGRGQGLGPQRAGRFAVRRHCGVRAAAGALWRARAGGRPFGEKRKPWRAAPRHQRVGRAAVSRARRAAH